MHYELVKVIDRTRLLNSVQLERPYRTTGGHKLAPGIYAVLWPVELEPCFYDASARYYGPFTSWRAAGEFARSQFNCRVTKGAVEVRVQDGALAP